jgi:hypothetical protein
MRTFVRFDLKSADAAQAFGRRWEGNSGSKGSR